VNYSNTIQHEDLLNLFVFGAGYSRNYQGYKNEKPSKRAVENRNFTTQSPGKYRGKHGLECKDERNFEWRRDFLSQKLDNKSR